MNCYLIVKKKVGGDWYHTIINKHMKKYGKATLCGSIDNYNDATPKLCKLRFLSKCLRKFSK